MDKCEREQSGAVGACWAHNPEVDGSKPFSAICNFSFSFSFVSGQRLLEEFEGHLDGVKQR